VHTVTAVPLHPTVEVALQLVERPIERSQNGITAETCGIEEIPRKSTNNT